MKNRMWAGWLAMATAAVLLGVAGMAASAQQLAAADEPEVVFSTFDNDTDLAKWQAGDSGKVNVSVENRVRTDRNKSLKVEVVSGDYPGIVTYKMPKDWSKYEVLSFEVWSNDSRILGIRIDDDNSHGYTTRYNGPGDNGVTIDKGHNLIQIPTKDIAKRLDLHKIKCLILFTGTLPKGYTLWYDNFRLGPKLTDKVDFIPYDQRIEPPVTTGVVSPHFPLASPLAGGPLKVLALYGVEEGRDLAELMERVDMKVSPVLWGREDGINKWIGMRYGDRSYPLCQRYLASSAQGPEKFDTMILSTPTGWLALGKGGTDAIMDRVKNKGEGLVLCFPFPGGGKNHPWPDDLRELSPLVDSITDFNRNGYMHWADDGMSTGHHWKIVKDHPITHGMQAALDALPYEAIRLQDYKPGPDSEVLIETDDGQPVVAVKTVGKGRVVTFAWRTESLAPHIDGPNDKRQWRDYRYWEVFYALMARAVLWTSHRDMAQDGDPVVLANPQFPDPNLTLKQWKNAQGQVTDFELGFIPPTYADLKVTAPEFLTRADRTLPVTFALPKDPPADASVTVRLVDYTGDRRRTMRESTFKLADAGKGGLETAGDGADRVTMSVENLTSLGLYVEAEITSAGKRIAFGQTVTFITPRPTWTDYEVYGWPAGGISYLRDLQMAQLRNFGLTTEQVGPNEAKQSFERGFRIQSMMSNTGMHDNGFDQKANEYARTGDKKLLIRTPSYADPVFLADLKRRQQNWLKQLLPYAPLTVSVGDETSLTSYTADFDFDFNTHNIDNFRTHLKSKFGTIDALNKALNTQEKDFDSIEPPTPPMDVAKRKGVNFGLWNEWRDFNDDMWAGGFRFLADSLKEVYPATRLSVSGTQVSGAFNGIDWAKLSLPLGATADYGGRFQIIKRTCFNPNIRSTPWCGYGREGWGCDYQLWSNLTCDGDGAAFFWYPSLLNPDFELSKSAADYHRALKVLRAGVGMQYQRASRQYSPVGILWSSRSQRAAWLEGKMDQFVKTEAKVYEGLIAAGYDPRWISDAQVAAGDLKARGIKALALPMTLSMGFGGQPGSQDELAAIRSFQADGGVVLYTDAVNCNEFLQPMQLPDDVGGKFVKFPDAPDQIEAAVQASTAQPYVEIRDDKGARVVHVSTSLQALHDAGDKPTGGYILTILREPVGQKEAVGADGVVYMVPDPASGPEVMKLVVDASTLAKGMQVYDLRSHQPVSLDGGKFTVDMQAGDGRPFAIMPYGSVTLNAAVDRSPEALTVTLALQTLQGMAVTQPHTVRMDVKDISTGEIDPLISENLWIPDGGKLTKIVPLAVEDGSRKFAITFTDMLTGAQQTVTP